MPESHSFLRYCTSAATWNFIMSGKSHVTLDWLPVAPATCAFKIVIFTASRRNTFVEGTCALPSALLIFC